MRRLRWTDEPFVRLYRRDVDPWLALSIEAQGLYALLRRKVDRAGVLDLDGCGPAAIAAVLGHAHRWPDMEPWLAELVAGGWVEILDDHLRVIEFVESEEAQSSPRSWYRVSFRQRVPRRVRVAVLARDGHACRYCGSARSLTVDHLVPVARGGSNAEENLVAACIDCNRKKWARTPEEAGLVLRPQPGSGAQCED